MIAQIKPDSELSALEVVRRVFKKHPEVLQYEDIITLMMINFAKQRCMEQREICAEYAMVLEEDFETEDFSHHSGGYIREEHYVCPDKDSIINAPLPKELQL